MVVTLASSKISVLWGSIKNQDEGPPVDKGG